MASSRYTTRFTFTATAAAQPSESDRLEAKASLNKLKALLPAGIDPEADETIVYAAGNLAVGGVANLNDDAVSIDDTIRIYPRFVNQQVNIEHQRDNVVGFIIKAGLSEMGTNRLITDEEARAAGEPFNIAIVIAFWRVVDPDLCDWVLRASAPGSPDQGKLSLSFEVGFDDYGIALLPKGTTNLAFASPCVGSDAVMFPKLDRALRVNGGTGLYGKEAQQVVRVLMGNIVPLGAGVVTVPAAAVKGLAAITENPHADEADAGLYKYSSTQCTLCAADAAPFIAYAASISDEHVYTDPNDPTLGREDEPHVSVLYGIHTAEVAPVATALEGTGPIRMTLGKVASFSDPDRPYDVLYVAVESPDLESACAKLCASLEYTNRYV